MARRNRLGKSGVSTQRAPMNMRLVTTRYGPSTAPLNLNVSARQRRRENWDDWVAVNQIRDLGILVSALKTWFPSLDDAFSSSDWEDIGSLRSKRPSPDQSPSKDKEKVCASQADGEGRSSTSSLQSVLEEDESETSGGDADVSAESSVHLKLTTTFTSASSDTTSRVQPGWRQTLPPSHTHHGERSPGASYITPRSYPTMGFSTYRSPGASYATPRSPLQSLSTDRSVAGPSFGSQSAERMERSSLARPSFSTLRYTPERKMNLSIGPSLEFTPIQLPLSLLPSSSSSVVPSSPYSDYAEGPSFSTQRSLHTAASFSTQRSTASLADASMGLALRLQQVSAFPTLTALSSLPSSATPQSTTPSTLSFPTNPLITPPRTRTSATPLRAYMPGNRNLPNSSGQCTPGTSEFASSSSFPIDTTATSTSLSLLPSLPSHMILSPSRSLSSFAAFDQRHSLPSMALLHDLDEQSFSYSRSGLSHSSMVFMTGMSPFLDDLGALPIGRGIHDRNCAIRAATLPVVTVMGQCSSGNEVVTRSATTKVVGFDRTLWTGLEAAPVVPRLPTGPLESDNDAAIGSGRMTRTVRNIQSMSSLRPPTSLQSLCAKFRKQPSEGTARPRIKSKGKMRPTLPSHFNHAPLSTSSKYRRGVPGLPVPQRSALLPRGQHGDSPLHGTSNGKPPKLSTRLRLRRPKSHLFRHEVATAEAEESERRLPEHLELHGQRREGLLKALRLRGLL